jgi:hypothetical protein
MSDRPKLYYHDHLGIIRGGEPTPDILDISPDTVIALNARIALLESAIRAHRNKMWEGYRVADRIDQQLYAVLQEDKT